MTLGYFFKKAYVKILYFQKSTACVNHRLENESTNNVTLHADDAEMEAALSKMYDEIKLQSLLYSYSNYD